MAGRRLTAYYVVLALAVAVVVTLVLSAGAKEKAQPAIAGGYDVSQGQACLGDQIDVRQSGQFASVQRADGSGAGKLRFKQGRLTGEANCLKGGHQPLRATVRSGVVQGTLGEQPLKAEFARDPPDPGAQKPSPPGAVKGDYKLVPRSACLGGKIELSGSSSALELAGKNVKGELVYGDAGKLTGTAPPTEKVTRFVGVASEPVIAEPGKDAILEAAGGAGLLVVGLSDRWRQEGLGPTRSELASSAPAPILFVRRGERAGALAPREDVTRFTWSSPNIGTVTQVQPTT